MNLSAEKDYSVIKGLLNHIMTVSETDPNWEMYSVRLEHMIPYTPDMALRNVMIAVTSQLRDSSLHIADLASVFSWINHNLPELNDIEKETVRECASGVVITLENEIANPKSCSDVLDKRYRTIKAYEALEEANVSLSSGSNIVNVFSNLSERFESLLQNSNEIRKVASFKDELIAEMTKKLNGETESMQTGLPTLDEILGHFGGEQLIILAGRPGMGKTTFAAAKIGDYVAGHHGNVLMFSQEMPCLEVAKRLVSANSMVDFKTLFYDGCPKMNSSEEQAMAKALESLCNEDHGNRFYLTGNVYNIMEICAAVRNFHRHKPLSLVIIDYLTLIGCNERNLYERASKISEDLRLLTKETKVPILCLSQMNRNYETRGQRAPQNSDLRDSGKIEQDAHVIMFLAPAGTPKASSAKCEPVKLYITKNRGGPCGEIPLNFYKDQCRFEEKSYETGMRATFTGISSVSE